MVTEALQMRNGPNTEAILSLPLLSFVRVWREKKGWTGPYRLLSRKDHDCIIEMPQGPRNFRSTVVRPYLEEEVSLVPQHEEIENDNHSVANSPNTPSFSDQKNDTEPQHQQQDTKRGEVVLERL